MSPSLHCRCLLSSVLSPMFMNRNAQSLGYGRRRKRTHTDRTVIYGRTRPHTHAHIHSHTHTHTAPYMYFTATKEELLSRVPIFQPLAAGGERIFQYAYGLKIVWIYAKQLSRQSRQSENYSNNGNGNGTISVFQSNLWIWMNSDWRGTLTKTCGSMVIKH